jgi:hypothetical protein
VYVTEILGGLLLSSPGRDRSTDALGWWVFGYLSAGRRSACWRARGEIPNVLSIEMPNAAAARQATLPCSPAPRVLAPRDAGHGCSCRAADLAHRHAVAAVVADINLRVVDRDALPVRWSR